MTLMVRLSSGDGPSSDLVIGFVAVVLVAVLAIILSDRGGRETVWQAISCRIAAAFTPNETRRTGVASRPVATAQPTTASAGWYPDPTNGWLLRYWDGAAWTDRFARDEAEPPPPDD